MRTRILRALAVIVMTVTAGLVAIPGASYAASDTRTTTGWSAGDHSFTSEIDANWRIGDCTLIQAWNPYYSYVYLTQPDSAGHATLTWGGVGETSHTNNADVWWTTFTFSTAFGTTIVTSPRLRGVDMRTVFQVYTWSVTIDITIDPALYPGISQVRWSSSC